MIIIPFIIHIITNYTESELKELWFLFYVSGLTILVLEAFLWIFIINVLRFN